MGCDIHLQVERRDKDGKWHRVPHADLPCDWCDGDDAKCYRCKGEGHVVREFFHDRNYDVFAILANVRNGYGFAGLDTGDGFEPIDEPRGLPDDLSDEIRAALRDDDWDYDDPQWFWLGDHSHSWLTVQELLDYDWARTTKKRGWVGVEQFQVYEREGRPQSWSGGISGQRIQHVSNQEMRRRIEEGTGIALSLHREGRSTLVEWEVAYTEVAEHFLRILNRDIVPLGAPADVRLVFGFDS
jgi:hypothetical protein